MDISTLTCKEMKEIIMKLSWKEFLYKYEDIKRMETFLRTKKFHLGDYVIVLNPNLVGDFYGVEPNMIGKVVGYDKELDVYQVKFDISRFIYYSVFCVSENNLRLYDKSIDGEIPQSIIDINPFNIESIVLKL